MRIGAASWPASVNSLTGPERNATIHSRVDNSVMGRRGTGAAHDMDRSSSPSSEAMRCPPLLMFPGTGCFVQPTDNTANHIRTKAEREDLGCKPVKAELLHRWS